MQGVDFPVSDDMLVGNSEADDATVYKLSDDTALVVTVDYFTPIVDDPYGFGYIAAVNSLSDVYAMGGKPLFALNVSGFPQDSLPPSVMTETLNGGAAACRAEGVAIGGGHTISSPEIFYGLCVVGTVHPERIIRNGGATPGQLLILTKPIGTGVISTAVKKDAAQPEWVKAARDAMCTSNRAAGEIIIEAGVECATDVTGFGIAGHGLEMARASGCRIVIETSRVPLLSGAYECADEGYIPGGLVKTFKFVEPYMEIHDSVDPEYVNLLCDPQTSGGLLVAVDEDKASAILGGVPGGAIIGRFEEGEPGIKVLS
ncbi:MAG: selenide, water dikinase SelD [bacterium]|nr:selenide, water dikinase SelD [bacterium]